MELNEKIRKLREIQQWTQEEMAEKATLSKNGYANIERGESIPNIESLEKIANVFGIKVEELINSDESNFVISVINGKGDYHTNYYHGSNALSTEIDKLQQKIQHQQELLEQKDIIINTITSENNLLKQMLEILKKD